MLGVAPDRRRRHFGPALVNQFQYARRNSPFRITLLCLKPRSRQA
jgi:hypothetical protein